MFDELKKIPVFIVRDFRILFTYKIAFFITFFGIIFNLFYFILFGSMFGSADIPALSAYGGNFISFILVGSIGWSFLWSIMNATSSSLASEMAMGTLESILLTSTRLATMMLSYALFGCFFGLISIAILMVVGFFIFGVTVFTTATIFTLIIFILSAIMMIGFGMMFGGLTIWLKNIGDAIPLLQNVSMFFCGVYFPISVLPVYLQPIAKYIPFYYSIEGLRISLITTSSTNELIEYVLILLALSIVFNIIGFYTLHKGLMKAKKDGSLAFY
jgi:ABC-2 type transport system permease protein